GGAGGAGSRRDRLGVRDRLHAIRAGVRRELRGHAAARSLAREDPQGSRVRTSGGSRRDAAVGDRLRAFGRAAVGMSLAVTSFLVFFVSCAAGLLVTPRVRTVGLRLRLVATPTADRWHQRPTALLGGVAIALATLVGVRTWTAASGAAGGRGGGPAGPRRAAPAGMSA